MKTFARLASLLFIGSGFTVLAQQPVPVSVAPAPVLVQRTAVELEQLLAPIALYPDALIALILPAATVPTDIVLAARHVRESGGDRSQIEHRAWDESVKSLTNYPDVLKWMDENLDWTRQVGEAFAQQPADTMQAVQRLRAKARDAGTLVDTPQQQVISEPQVIRIVPAQPNVIYVPHYEPEVVFVDRPVYYSQPVVTFGVGVAAGSWLAYDCDWRRHSIWVGDRHRRWSGHDWHRPVVPFSSPHNHGHTHPVRQWRPPVHVSRTPSFATTHSYRPPIVRPTSTRTSYSSYAGSSYNRSSQGSSTYGSSSQARSYAPRPGSTESHRGDAAFRSPTASLPRSGSPTTRSDIVGPRAPAGAVVPPVGWSAPAATPPSAAAPSTRTPSQPRQSGSDWRRSRDSSASTNQTAATPPPTGRSLPMASPALSAPATHPTTPRSEPRAYSRPPRSSAPVASLPMAAPASAPSTHPVAPSAPSHSYSRGQRSGSAGPSLPMASPAARAVPPMGPSVQPATPPAAAPAAAAPVATAPVAPSRSSGQDGGSRSGGRRGGWNGQDR